MKFLHISDLHLASPLTSRLSPARIEERKRELIDTFLRLCDEGERLGVRGIVIAGDLFDRERVSQKNAATVADILHAHPGIAFFYLPGNHERGGFLRAITPPDNLFVFGEDWTTFDLGDVALYGRSETAGDMFASLPPSDAPYRLCVLHGELTDHSGEGGKIGKREIAAVGFDYVALGHYHAYQDIPLSPLSHAVYCGTPEGRGFDETGEKGYVLVDTDTRTHTFVPFAKRTLHLLPVTVEGTDTPLAIEEKIEEALAALSPEDPVRVVLRGKCAVGLHKDIGMLQDRFRDRRYYLEVIDETKPDIPLLAYRNDPSLKGEFTRLVLDSDLDEEEKMRVLDCGFCALGGEDWI